MRFTFTHECIETHSFFFFFPHFFFLFFSIFQPPAVSSPLVASRCIAPHQIPSHHRILASSQSHHRRRWSSRPTSCQSLGLGQVVKLIYPFHFLLFLPFLSFPSLPF